MSDRAKMRELADKYPMSVDDLIEFHDLVSIEVCNAETKSKDRLLGVSLSSAKELERMRDALIALQADNDRLLAWQASVMAEVGPKPIVDDIETVNGDPEGPIVTDTEQFFALYKHFEKRALSLAAKLKGAQDNGIPAGALVVAECDVVPHVHPQYGSGMFFTENALLGRCPPQPIECGACDTGEPCRNEYGICSRKGQPARDDARCYRALCDLLHTLKCEKWYPKDGCTAEYDAALAAVGANLTDGEKQ